MPSKISKISQTRGKQILTENLKNIKIKQKLFKIIFLRRLKSKKNR